MKAAARGSSPALTRLLLVGGGAFAGAAGWLVVAGRLRIAAATAGASAAVLLTGGHRANHGAGGPAERILDALVDRAWDGAVLGAIVWWARGEAPHAAAGALVALGASFLSSYVRARGASLGYAVEESHVTRGLRYALIVFGLATNGLGWTVWATACVATLAAIVRAGQVAKEERL